MLLVIVKVSLPTLNITFATSFDIVPFVSCFDLDTS